PGAVQVRRVGNRTEGRDDLFLYLPRGAVADAQRAVVCVLAGDDIKADGRRSAAVNIDILETPPLKRAGDLYHRAADRTAPGYRDRIGRAVAGKDASESRNSFAYEQKTLAGRNARSRTVAD